MVDNLEFTDAHLYWYKVQIEAADLDLTCLEDQRSAVQGEFTVIPSD